MNILGDLESGIIIEAPMPMHLGNSTQRMVLTPAMIKELIEKLAQLSRSLDGILREESR